MTTLNAFNKVDNTTSVLAAHINDLIASTLRSEYSNVETLSGTRTLLDVDTPIQRFDCNGTNRIVLCPTANTDDNHPFLLVNASDGGETLTVKNNAGSVTLVTLTEGRAVLILPDGAGAYVVASGGVQSIVAGSGVAVDDTDPANPVVSASGGLTISVASVTTSNVTGVEDTHHILDVSGMTANRDFNLPTPTAAGKRCKVTLSAGDATYELIVKVNTVEVTRLFITNETMEFVSTGTGAANWQISQNGMIACSAEIENNDDQPFTNITDAKVVLDELVSDNASIADITN